MKSIILNSTNLDFDPLRDGEDIEECQTIEAANNEEVEVSQKSEEEQKDPKIPTTKRNKQRAPTNLSGPVSALKWMRKSMKEKNAKRLLLPKVKF